MSGARELLRRELILNRVGEDAEGCGGLGMKVGGGLDEGREGVVP